MVKGLEDVVLLSIGWPCHPSMGLLEVIWLERSRKYSGRRLGGSKT